MEGSDSEDTNTKSESTEITTFADLVRCRHVLQPHSIVTILKWNSSLLEPRDYEVNYAKRVNFWNGKHQHLFKKKLFLWHSKVWKTTYGNSWKSWFRYTYLPSVTFWGTWSKISRLINSRVYQVSYYLYVATSDEITIFMKISWRQICELT